MINEINLRTNKNEYNPGEVIFGVVYLRITSPTRGRGIQVSFQGYEKVLYEYKKNVAQENVIGYKDHRDYINYNEVLHESEEPLAICSTLYPFKIHLPTEIPGTFYACNETADVRWEAVVAYILKVHVIDAGNVLKTGQPIFIRQQVRRGVLTVQPPVGVSFSYEKSKLLLFTACINVTARLLDHIYRSGESLKLRIIITNNSRILVQSLKIKLLRSISLICKKELQMSINDPNVTGANDKWNISIENWSSVIREQDITMTHLQSGLDCLLIPLKNDDGSPIYPSVSGKHVNCEYKVHIDVSLSNGNTFELEVPVSVIIHSKDQQWSHWRCPSWVSDEETNVHHSVSVLGVPENVLFSEAFSAIPGFQPL